MQEIKSFNEKIVEDENLVDPFLKEATEAKFKNPNQFKKEILIDFIPNEKVSIEKNYRSLNWIEETKTTKQKRANLFHLDGNKRNCNFKSLENVDC